MSSDSHAKKLVRVSTGREVADVLRDLYLEQRRTQQEIADSLGVSRDTIVRWLGEYGISRNDREPLDPLVAA